MRRAWMVAAGVALPALAHAAPSTTVQAEAGVEYDTNVERIEDHTTVDNQPLDPIAAAVSRFGGRIVHRDRVLGGAYTLDVAGLARIVAASSQPSESVSDPSAANIGTFSVDGRWIHALGDRPVSAGLGVTFADAFALCSDCIGDRTFKNLGADGILAMRASEDRHLTFAVGYRDFEYKPAAQFSWTGPTASARLDAVLSQTEDHTRSLELAVTAGADVRQYDDTALVSAPCPTGSGAGMSCAVSTTFPRRDRYERAGVELTYVGRRIASVGYQLGAIESNSFGQSLVRHRLTASATSEIAGGVFATLLGTLQFDQYPDGLVVLVSETQQFRNLEDESRSSLQLRLAKHVKEEWSIEARAAIWRNLGDTQGDEFHRTLVSLGVVYSK